LFKKLTSDIYKLDIPFYTVTTSSFLVISNGKSVLVDCGTYKSDVEEIIIPALNDLKIQPDYIFLTHSHDDHAGGLETLFKNLPNIKLICFNKALCEKFGGKLLKNGDEPIEGISFLSLPGHSFDSGALWLKNSASIITGDCLQQWGIKQYGCGVHSPKEYKKSIARLKAMKIENIFAAHEYYPLGSVALGKVAVKEYLDECENIYNEIISFTLKAIKKGILNNDIIAEGFHKEKIKAHPNMPTIPSSVFGAIASKSDILLGKNTDKK